MLTGGFFISKLSYLSRAKNCFTQVNSDLEIVAIHQSCEKYFYRIAYNFLID